MLTLAYIISSILTFSAMPAVRRYYLDRYDPADVHDGYWWTVEFFTGNHKVTTAAVPMPAGMFFAILIPFVFWPLFILSRSCWAVVDKFQLDQKIGAICRALYKGFEWPGKLMAHKPKLLSAKDEYLLQAEKEVEALCTVKV